MRHILRNDATVTLREQCGRYQDIGIRCVETARIERTGKVCDDRGKVLANVFLRSCGSRRASIAHFEGLERGPIQFHLA